MHRGYIKLYRRSYEHPFYNEHRPKTRREAWEDILMLANHTDKQVIVGNKVIMCKRGESVRSLQQWAEYFHWSKSATRRFFNLLENMGQIRHGNETQTTRITVCNYEEYQGGATQQPTQEAVRRRNASETQVDPNKNVKKEKKEIHPALMDCATHLRDRILEHRQQKITEETLTKWANTARLMHERDGRSTADIHKLIDQCHDMPEGKNGFTWRKNILSMEKLREHWNNGKIFIGIYTKPNTFGNYIP